MYKTASFTPLGMTLQSSYEQVKRALLLLCKLLVVRILLEGVLIGIFLSLFFTVGVGSVISHLSFDQTMQSVSYFSVFSMYNTWIFTVGMVGVSVLYAATASMLSIATMIAVGKQHHNLTLAEIFHISMQRFIPFVITQVISMFFILGGFFALILPGIGMMILFTFAPFVVVFERKSGMEALQRSLSLIVKHPFTIIGRILLLWGMGTLLFLFFFTTFFQSLHTSIQILTFVIANVGFWWYSIAYVYLLYKEAVVKTSDDSFSLTQVWLLSLCGWLLAIVISISIFQFITKGPVLFSKHTNEYVYPKQSYSVKEI